MARSPSCLDGGTPREHEARFEIRSFSTILEPLESHGSRAVASAPTRGVLMALTVRDLTPLRIGEKTTNGPARSGGLMSAIAS
jgi:hypothetical protein